MATDPIPALLALAKDRPDPRAVSNWITAYLGKRSPDDRVKALTMLRREFEARQAAEPRIAGLVLKVIERLEG